MSDPKKPPRDPHALLRRLLETCGGDLPLLAAALELVEREIEFDRAIAADLATKPKDRL